MIKKISVSLAGLSAMLAFCNASLADSQLTLKIGDPAPKYEVATWLKGTPIPKLKQGQVYLLEYWATSCAPCIKALPHLKALSEQYNGKVTFIAIGQPYDSQTAAEVKEFVRKKGDLMPYAVGLDTLHGQGEKMYDRWGPPAGFGGLPVTFVVDGAGKIAWAGMPTEVDKPLQQIVAGSYDMTAARRQQEIDHEAAVLDSDLREGFRGMLGRKEYPATIQKVDMLVARDPANEPEVFAYKLMALMETDRAEAVVYAQSLPPTLQGQAAELMADRDDLPVDAYKFIAQQLQKEVDANSDAHPVSWQMLAKTYHRLGDLDHAIKALQTALDKSVAMNYAEFITELRKTMDEYKAEKAAQK